MIVLPEAGIGCPVVASVSGGKDSTALILALREAEIPARYVFADTAWEAPETYAYLDAIQDLLGITIDRVGVPGGMIARVAYRAGFPARMQRWCTRELKLQPLRAYHDQLCVEDTVSALGVRADESEARASLPEWEDSDEWGGYIWRPLLRWSVADVLAIHRRHRLPVNPLYQWGHNRVGCYPCIYAAKEEIRLIAQHHPERIALIEQLEREMTAERAQRNAVTPGRYAHPTATFFQPRFAGIVAGIRDVVGWSQTDTGGRQWSLLEPAPAGGCMKWGMCETLPGETPDA